MRLLAAAITVGVALVSAASGSTGAVHGHLTRLPAHQPSAIRLAEAPGLLVFQGLADGDSEIYVVRSNGGLLKRLTRNAGPRPAADDVRPEWSPDGRHIIWSRGASLHVMNADGSGKWRLPARGQVDYSWSPNGRKIAFGSRGDLYVITANGTGLRRLTRNLRRGELDVTSHSSETLQWSPDSRWIAFPRDGLYVIKPDGTGLRRLLRDQDFWPFTWRWSPDGRRIAVVDSEYGSPNPIHRIGVVDVERGGVTWFGRGEWSVFTWAPHSRQLALLCGPDPASADICVINIDGTGIRNLTESPNQDEWPPVWSPDGGVIAFAVGKSGIFALDPREARPIRRITARFGPPLWSPGGRRIAFKDGFSGHGAIYVVGADGRDLTKVADRALNPAWQPSPRRQ